VCCYIWYSKEGAGQAAASLSLLLAVPNVTAHPAAATVLLYGGSLLCSFNVVIEGLKAIDHNSWPHVSPWSYKIGLICFVASTQ